MLEWRNLKSKEKNGYELVENDNNLASIFLSDKKSSFKASLNIENESYKIKRTGFWKSIIVVIDKKDELIARAGFEKLHYGKGVIEINMGRYYYKFANTPLTELILFQKETNPLASYKLSIKNKSFSTELTTDKQLDKSNNKLLLLSIGWYMFQPIIRENEITNWIS